MAASTAAFEVELLATTLGGPTNVLQNPSGATATTGWSVFGSGGTNTILPASDADFAGGGMQVDIGGTTGASSLYTPLATDGTSSLNMRPVLPGEYYAMRGKLKITRQFVNVPAKLGIMPRIDNSGGSNIAGPSATVFTEQNLDTYPAGTLITLAGVVGPIPATGAFAGPQFFTGGVPIGANGAMLAGDFLMVKSDATNSPVPGYFDGDTPGYGWTGTPYASTSQARVAVYNPTQRGLMAGAAYKLRSAYLAGVADPTAHTLAKNHFRQVKALNDNSKLASFDAITGP